MKKWKFIGLIILLVLITSTTIYAVTTLYDAVEVEYDNSNSGTEETDVQGALDELYELSKNHCPDGYVCKSSMMGESEVQNANSPFLNGPITRGTIESVRISNTKAVPGTVLGSWDVSESQNESVIAYYSDNDSDGLYEVVIGGEGGVSAPSDCRQLFNGLTNVTSFNLMYFDTSSVTNMSYMFSNCSSLETLDLSSFDTSKVELMNDMFVYCNKLVSLDLSSFETTSLVSANYMFHDNRNLTNLDIRNMTFDSVSSYTNMLYGVKSGVNIIVKNSASKTFIEARLRDAGGTGNVVIA